MQITAMGLHGIWHINNAAFASFNVIKFCKWICYWVVTVLSNNFFSNYGVLILLFTKVRINNWSKFTIILLQQIWTVSDHTFVRKQSIFYYKSINFENFQFFLTFLAIFSLELHLINFFFWSQSYNIITIKKVIDIKNKRLMENNLLRKNLSLSQKNMFYRTLSSIWLYSKSLLS